MCCWLLSTVLLATAAGAPAASPALTGQYVEARTCEIWAGSCFGNAEMNLSGKHAVLAWKVQKGTLDSVRLDGLGVVAVLAASNTLGLEQTGPARVVLIVDTRADAAQRKALVRLAKQQGGPLLRNVIAVQTASVELTLGEGKDEDVAQLTAGEARIRTRRLDPQRDRVCGGEKEFYPPLSSNVTARPAVALEHRFSGRGLRETWSDNGRRSAYVGRFAIP